MGAGAVGCYYGAMLARTGARVVLIGRPLHVEPIQRRGLTLETDAGVSVVRVEATTDPGAAAEADLLLFAVKAGDTEASAAQIAGALSEKTTVLCLQNGVESAGRLQAVLQRPVLAGSVYAAVEMSGPGQVRHRGGGGLTIEASEASEGIAALLNQAGIATDISHDMTATLWRKLIVNCALNAISALSASPYGRMIEGEGAPALMREIVAECVGVAERRGASPPADIADAVMKIAASMPHQFSSMAQDLRRGRKTEIDALNGFVVRAGEALGVATPVNRTLVALVKLIENKTQWRGEPA
jgi:2-dehydropantoate 2-reductase